MQAKLLRTPVQKMGQSVRGNADMTFPYGICHHDIRDSGTRVLSDVGPTLHLPLRTNFNLHFPRTNVKQSNQDPLEPSTKVRNDQK